jgi:hypothetical protein
MRINFEETGDYDVEIVNDSIGNQSYSVTYCPLCGSGVVFATNVGEDASLNFGVSGLLYNSDLIMYDRNTDSLWSQLSGHAIAGELVGVELPRMPVVHTTWDAWRGLHADSLLMRGHPEFKRLYSRSPYPGYERSRRLFFDVSDAAPRQYHPKEWVLGVETAGVFKAYPFIELKAHGLTNFEDRVGEQTVVIEWEEDSWSAVARSAAGEFLPATMSFWFAWFTFHPDTQVFTAQ